MDDPEFLSALTSFNPFIDPTMITNAAASGAFVNRLRDEYSFIVRNTSVEVIGSADPHRPLRASTHLWHDLRDVDKVVDACWDLANRIHRGM